MKNTIGKKIQQLRINKGISQNDLANYFHISHQTVSKWENDVNIPDVLTCKELANFFSVSLDYLLDNVSKEVIEIDISVNQDGKSSVWTDYLVEGTIAPKAIMNEMRHRTSSKTKYWAVDRDKSGYGLGKHNVLAINSEGKIVYFTNDCYGYSGFEYDCGYQGKPYALRDECMIIGENYKPWSGNDPSRNVSDSEIVIPKGGMIIILDVFNEETNKVMDFILSRIQYREYLNSIRNNQYGRFFRGFVYGDLDNATFEIKDGKLRITKKIDLNSATLSKEIKDYIDEVSALYEQKIKDLEAKNMDLEDRIEDLEMLEARVMELENKN
ncbi:MAG: helix-turn-helix domain-containing protein [Bacilli bacterium]|nr:helix-turn-helix domain-containing protein [Bacilli bacterium]